VVDSGNAPPTVVRQRATIVTSSNGKFYSRLYRVARGIADRGHEVTVIARWEPGLPRDERHPSGYRVLRIDAGPLDGVPVVGRWRVRRRARRGLASVTERPVARPRPVVPASGGTALRARFRRVRDAVAPIGRPLTMRGLASVAATVAPRADVYHVIGYTRLPVGLALGRRDAARVVYDAADIYMEAGQLADLRGPGRWILARGERRGARAADRVVTANDAYADVMAERWGVERPLVVMNCSYRFTRPVETPRRFHELLGLVPDDHVVLYHGNLYPERGIEQLIEAIPDVPSAVLVLMGSGPLEAASRSAATRSPAAERIRFVAPVPPEALLDWVASADVVAMPIQGSSLNHRLTTPQKLFEAMSVGVPVLASDLPGMAAIVRETGCGVLVDPTDVRALARAIAELVDAPAPVRAAYRARGLAAASEKYNWERQLDGLLDEYTRLTARRW
jgi:glycosyltransferase involved in cell wall biosynthesis